MGNEKIQDFTDLRVWQEAHKLALAVYTFTKKFPKEEIFALTSQMRRAAHFYTMASASVYELRNQTILAVDLGYVSANVSSATQSNAIIVQKMLTALIKTIERP
jgi:23S rRNA-intervening sequence protein